MRLRMQARVCKQHESGARMWQKIMSATKPYRACNVSKAYTACALQRPQAVARGRTERSRLDAGAESLSKLPAPFASSGWRLFTSTARRAASHAQRAVYLTHLAARMHLILATQPLRMRRPESHFQAAESFKRAQPRNQILPGLLPTAGGLPDSKP